MDRGLDPRRAVARPRGDRGEPGGGAGWTATCREIADATLFPKADSWIFGANIPGKKNAVMFYMAGIGAYRGQLAEVRASDYRGFTLDAA